MTLPLDFRSFAYYHPRYKRWITEDGDFEILVGASSRDIRLKEIVTLRSTLDLPCPLDRDSTIRDWLEDKRGGPAFQPLYEQIKAGTTAAFGSD